MGRKKVDEVQAGDLCAILGLDAFEIGDTIADVDYPDPLPSIAIDEPTMSMLFTINDSPFFGQDGKFVTSRHIKDRLEKNWNETLLCDLRIPTPLINLLSMVGEFYTYLY